MHGAISNDTFKFTTLSANWADANWCFVSRKQALTFYANRFLLLRKQFAWNVKVCFLGTIRTNHFKMPSAKDFTQHARHWGLSFFFFFFAVHYYQQLKYLKIISSCKKKKKKKTKEGFMQHENNDGQDQHGHPCSMIRTFVFFAYRIDW